MDYKKIREIEERIKENKKKLNIERESKKKEILRLKIAIDEYKIKLEKLKRLLCRSFYYGFRNLIKTSFFVHPGYIDISR